MKKEELKQLITETYQQIIKEDESEEIQDESEGYLTNDDGWDHDEIENIGLKDWLKNVERIAYELDGARRGTYGISGTTAQNLIDDLEGIKMSLEDIIETINENLNY